MNSLGRACLGLWTVAAALAFAGCGDDSSPGGSEQGGQPGSAGQSASVSVSQEAQCQVLGELCHEADSGSGDAHECHELGHVGDGAACAEGFAGCVKVCVEGSARQEPLCASLGELCHAVDDQDGPLHECHELGHVNDQAVCAGEFDRCAGLCLAAREALEHGGGGAGAGGSHGHEGGAAHGGAGGAG
jgi:hypothetical protein